jgi:hypothetical protein
MKAVNYTRSKTMSFKATPVEDLEIKKRAEQKNMSPSDFMHSLTMIYMDDYVLAGKSVREQELKDRIEELIDLCGKEKFKTGYQETEIDYLRIDIQAQIKDKIAAQNEYVKLCEENVSLKEESVLKDDTIEAQKKMLDKFESKAEETPWGLSILNY